MLQVYTTEDEPVPCPECGRRRHVQVEAPILLTHADGREVLVEGEVPYGKCGPVWWPGAPAARPEER